MFLKIFYKRQAKSQKQQKINLKKPKIRRWNNNKNKFYYKIMKIAHNKNKITAEILQVKKVLNIKIIKNNQYKNYKQPHNYNKN